VIALVMGILIGYKTFWWSGALVGVAALAFFLWIPGSGRYLVDPEGGARPMRLDERMQVIRDRAARTAFVTLMLTLAAMALYFGFIQPGDIPLQILLGVLGLGFLAYFVSDALQRQGSAN
jgi:predicted MFS family arabinose efflux permease